MPTSRRLRFGFATAFALSLALHLAFAPLVRVARADAEPEPSADPLVVTSVTPRPRPSPRPVPTRTPVPRRSALPAPQRPPRTPHIVAHPRVAQRAAPRSVSHVPLPAEVVATDEVTSGAGAGPVDAPSDTATATPAPVEPTSTPTPKPACARPESDARVRDAVVPEVPAIARQRQAFGTVEVRVDLDASGIVRGVAIARSADPSLDEAALDAARRSTYAAAISACRAQAGSYLFRVDFDG